MKKFNTGLIVLIATFWGLVSCKNKTQTAQNAPPPVSTLVLDFKKGFYVQLKGKMGPNDITMNLVTHPTRHSEHGGEPFSGYFYRADAQEPSFIYGQIDAAGNLVLTDGGADGGEAQFKGKMNADGSFEGSYVHVEKKQSIPFSLKPAPPNVGFDVVYLQDSVKLLPKNPKSPLASIEAGILLPNASTDINLLKLIRNQIFKGISGDSINRNYSVDANGLFNEMRNSYFQSYKENNTNFEPSDDETGSASWVSSASTDVVYNENGILSLAFPAYGYAGGAHGNHGTLYTNIDVSTKKVLQLSDIFLPKFEKKLDAALDAAVRKRMNIPKGESLDGYLLVEKMAHNQNFHITQKGITFHYNPYEIASYAEGEIYYFLPFTELKDIVQPKFLK